MKTAIIGLDGATFDIINPLDDAGRLPVLSRLMKEGSAAPLRSTILPNSFPGWASCTTGTSEGLHGVFSPFIKNPNSYSVRAMSGRDIMTRKIWDYVTEQGGRSLVINVPTTYPPEPLNGLMITGMLTPSLDSDFTYPPSFKEEMLAGIPAYVIEPGRDPDRRKRAQEFRNAVDMHELAAHALMDRGDWDFLMIVFSVLDRAQHDYWADMDPEHPRHDPKTPAEFREFIPEMYQRLDSAIGRLIEKLPGDTRVFVVSDHGFCAERMEVRVNELLARAGLLTSQSSSRRGKAFFRSARENVLRRLGRNELSGNVLDRKVQYGSAFLDEIDWSRTEAYFAQDKGVWVNRAGREPEGIVREADVEDVLARARAAIEGLVCGEDGLPVFERVMTRAEAFAGPYADRLPDLVMVPRRDDYVYNERPGYGETIVEADSTTGTHSKDGIFIAWGKGVTPEGRFEAQPNLRDVAPAALHSLGCPLPIDIDARLLSEIFSADSGPMRAGSCFKEARSTPDGVYTSGEETQLRERLRALGYIE